MIWKEVKEVEEVKSNLVFFKTKYHVKDWLVEKPIHNQRHLKNVYGPDKFRLLGL